MRWFRDDGSAGGCGLGSTPAAAGRSPGSAACSPAPAALGGATRSFITRSRACSGSACWSCSIRPAPASRRGRLCSRCFVSGCSSIGSCRRCPSTSSRCSSTGRRSFRCFSRALNHWLSCRGCVGSAGGAAALLIARDCTSQPAASSSSALPSTVARWPALRTYCRADLGHDRRVGRPAAADHFQQGLEAVGARPLPRVLGPASCRASWSNASSSGLPANASTGLDVHQVGRRHVAFLAGGVASPRPSRRVARGRDRVTGTPEWSAQLRRAVARRSRAVQQLAGAVEHPADVALQVQAGLVAVLVLELVEQVFDGVAGDGLFRRAQLLSLRPWRLARGRVR